MDVKLLAERLLKAEREVIGIDPYYYSIDDYYGHWIKIKYGAVSKWS